MALLQGSAVLAGQFWVPSRSVSLIATVHEVKVSRPYVRYLVPIPFLLGLAMIATAFWQNDADFVFENAVSIDAVFIDSGAPQSGRGRPRFFPTFQLADGRLLTVERATVAAELPQKGQAVQFAAVPRTRETAKCQTVQKAISFFTALQPYGRSLQ